MPKNELRALITALSGTEPTVEMLSGDSEDVEVAFRNAIARVPGTGNKVVLVCGTTFIMASARAAVGIVEPRDSNILIDATNSTPHGKSNTDAQENFAKS